MKKVILSFDYELFFGERSGTVDNSIIRPTELLLNKLDKINGKATFFVDYLMIKYLEAQPKTTKEARKITTQLQEIVQQGHRIELHIHPHWIDACYTGDGTWDFKDFTQFEFIAGRHCFRSIYRRLRDVEQNCRNCRSIL